MPPGGMKIPIDINLAQVRKSFREMNKLQKKSWKVRQRQIRVEEKASKSEMKGITKEHKTKQKFMTDEMKHTKRLRDERGRFIKKEQQFGSQQRRHASNDHRKATTRMRSMGREAKKQGLIGRGARTLGRGAALAGGGLIGFAIGYALKAYQNRMAAMQSMQPVIGSGFTFPGLMRDKSKGSIRTKGGGRYRGGNLGYDIRQRAGMAPGMARATGSTSVVPMMEAMRATGMNQGEVAGMFGAQRAGGTQFGGGKGKREFQNIISAGMQSGLEKGRLPEFFAGVTSLMQTQQAVAAGDVGAGGIAKLAAALGQSKMSGFQGKRGMAIMQKLQGGITRPGGGEAGMAFMRQAFGFGGSGGSSTSFYQAERTRQQGFGKNAGGFRKVMDELTSQYGTGEDASIKMEELFGTSYIQNEELIKLYKEGNLSAENMERVQGIMEEAEPLEKQAARAMKQAATSLKKIAGRFDRTVGDGAAAAKAIEAVEDFQKKMYELMKKWLPKIANAIMQLIAIVKEIWAWIKKAFPLKDIVEGTKSIYRGLTGGTSDDVRKATKEIQSGGRGGKGVDFKQLQHRMAFERNPKKRAAIAARLDQMGSDLYDAGSSVGTPNIGGQTNKRLARKRGSGLRSFPVMVRIWYDEAGVDPNTATPEEQQKAYAAARAAMHFEDKNGGWDQQKAFRLVKKSGSNYGAAKSALNAGKAMLNKAATAASDYAGGSTTPSTSSGVGGGAAGAGDVTVRVEPIQIQSSDPSEAPVPTKGSPARQVTK